MDTTGNHYAQGERRRYPRLKASIPVSICCEPSCESSGAAMRAATQDISLCGCYVENMFTLEIGAKVSLTLWLGDEPVHTSAVVATRYPQLGNGFDFIDMSPQDRMKLYGFIANL